MKKYQYSIDEIVFDDYNKPIRNKIDLIILLLNSLRYINSYNEINVDNLESNPQMVILIDKMSRIFFYSESKIFSIQFPFIFTIENQELHISVRNSGVCINSMVLSVVNSIFEQIRLKDIFFEDFYDLFIDEIFSYYDERCFEMYYDIWEVIKELLLFEPGYLRYDYDEEHEDKEMHPLNHLDLYYSSNTTFKLGLENRFTINNFIDLLDVNKSCLFVK